MVSIFCSASLAARLLFWYIFLSYLLIPAVHFFPFRYLKNILCVKFVMLFHLFPVLRKMLPCLSYLHCSFLSLTSQLLLFKALLVVHVDCCRDGTVVSTVNPGHACISAVWQAEEFRCAAHCCHWAHSCGLVWTVSKGQTCLLSLWFMCNWVKIWKLGLV